METVLGTVGENNELKRLTTHEPKLKKIAEAMQADPNAGSWALLYDAPVWTAILLTFMRSEFGKKEARVTKRVELPDTSFKLLEAKVATYLEPLQKTGQFKVKLEWRKGSRWINIDYRPKDERLEKLMEQFKELLEDGMRVTKTGTFTQAGTLLKKGWEREGKLERVEYDLLVFNPIIKIQGAGLSLVLDEHGIYDLREDGLRGEERWPHFLCYQQHYGRNDFFNFEYRIGSLKTYPMPANQKEVERGGHPAHRALRKIFRGG